MNEGIESAKDFGKKVEDRMGYVPDHPLTGVLLYVLSRYHSYLLGKDRDDLYQTCAEFLVQIDADMESKYGPDIDYKKLDKAQADYVFRAFDKHLKKFERSMGYTVTQFKRNTSLEGLLTNENGETIDSLVNSDWNAELVKDNEWFQDNMDLCREIILGPENGSSDKGLQWKIFELFVGHAAEHYASGKRGENDFLRKISEQLGISGDKILDEINKAVELIKTKKGNNKEFRITSNSGILEHGATTSAKKKEFHLDLNLPRVEQIKIVRDLLGLEDENEYKRKRTHIFRLIDRAQRNGGLITYYPGYHQKA